MTLAITSRYQVGSTASSQFKTSSAFTPSANCKLYVVGWAQALGGTTTGMTVTDNTGGSLIWTQKAIHNPSPSTGFRPIIVMWETDVGVPTSMTVTVTLNGGTGAEVSMMVFDVTGNSPQIKTGQIVANVQGAPTTVTTGVLPAATTNGNLVIWAEGANRDSFTQITAPASWTILARTSTGGGQYEHVAVFYATNLAINSDSHSNNPDNEDVGTVLFEIEESGGGGGTGDFGCGGWLLEDGSGYWQLEDASGEWLLDTVSTCTTTVGSSRSSTWKVDQTIVSTRANTWTTKATIVANRASTWNVLTPVVSTRSSTWNVAGAPVVSTRASTWAVNATIVSTRASTWNTLARVFAGPITDNFNRVGSTLGTSSSGQPWIVPWGTFTTDGTEVTAGHGGQTTPFDGGLAVIESGASDVTVTVTRTFAGREGGLVVRYVDENNFIRFNNSIASKFVGGVSTTIGVYEAVGGIGTGDTETVILQGSSVILKKNGVEILNVTVPELTTATKHGIATWETGGVNKFDNFSITFNAGLDRSSTWNVLAPVGTTRASTWKVDGRVVSTRSSTWIVRAIVASTRASTWAVLTSTTSTRSSTWAVRQAVVATRTSTWNVLAAVITTRANTWNVRAVILATRSSTWSVLTPTVSTRSSTWVVRAAVVATRASTWSVLAAVVSTRASTWNVIGPVGSSRSSTWNVIGIIVTSRSSTWNVDATGNVGSSRSSTWTVRATIVATRASTWTVRTTTVSTRTSTWTVRAAINANRSSTWNVRAVVNTARTSTWAVLTSTVSTRTSTWKVLAAITATRTSTWNVRATVVSTRAGTWAVFAQITSNRSSTWKVTFLIVALRSSTWNVLATVESFRSSTWSFEGATGTVDTHLEAHIVVGTARARIQVGTARATIRDNARAHIETQDLTAEVERGEVRGYV